jgi:energy-coupling factor transport system ATP-binding protein
LLLDEPTKGIDAHSKNILADILKKLKSEGITIIIVTHDIEFAAITAERCALFFDGEITSVDIPSPFFSGNSFYTTAANRISRHMYKNAITCGDVIKLCRINEVQHE